MIDTVVAVYSLGQEGACCTDIEENILPAESSNMLQQKRETRRSLTRDYMEARRCMEQGQEVGSNTDRPHQSTAKHKGGGREQYSERAACPVVSWTTVVYQASREVPSVGGVTILRMGVRTIDSKVQ